MSRRTWLFLSVFVCLLLFLRSAVNNDNRVVSDFSTPVRDPRPTEEQQPLGFDIECSDSLTERQCTDFFPDLYHDIDRRVAYWQERKHIISSEDVEISSWRKPVDGEGGGAMRVLIHENELRILEVLGTMSHLGYRGRAVGALNLLQRAVDSASAGGEKLPTIEAAFVLQDNSDPPEGTTHSIWSVSSFKGNEDHNRVWLFPNFDFWYAYPMGSYRDARRNAFQHDSSFATKIPKVIWRGGLWVNQDLRGALANITEGKDWADVKIVDWGGKDDPDGLPVDHFCKYAFTAHTEGISYSGRLKYLLACDSVPIVHKLNWNVYYSHLLIPEGPDQNCISVERDWTDLEEKVKYYLDNPTEAERIITNSLNTFRRRYLTRAAQSCYIRKLIRGYSKVSFKPETDVKLEKDGSIVRRGYSFERFFDSPLDRTYTTESSDD